MIGFAFTIPSTIVLNLYFIPFCLLASLGKNLLYFDKSNYFVISTLLFYLIEISVLYNVEKIEFSKCSMPITS